jgi:hypothetical protein
MTCSQLSSLSAFSFSIQVWEAANRSCYHCPIAGEFGGDRRGNRDRFLGFPDVHRDAVVLDQETDLLGQIGEARNRSRRVTVVLWVPGPATNR